MKKHTASTRIMAVCKVLVLFFYALIVLFPFFWILSTSLKGSQAEIYAYPVRYWPEFPSWINYTNMLTKGNFGRYFLNSLFVSSMAAVLSVFLGILAGYVIARYRFKGRKAVLFIYLFTQMIPMFLMLAPLYQLMSKLGLINSIWSLVILYTNMMIPFSVVTLRGFFQGIPQSLEEAAQIDGCGRLAALFSVILPVMLPGIASTFIFAFINSWNELFAAIMFIDVDKYRTIPVALNALILKYDIKWGEMSAGVVMSILPTMILFSFAQKYMAEGLTAGAVKG